MRKTKLNPVSKKRQKQRLIELDVKRQIWELGNGLCELCKKHPIADMGHEIIFRSQGGSCIDPFNIAQLCLRCHSREQGEILGEKPHTKEDLLKMVREIRIGQGFKEDK